jgi:PPOX class probable F420-dependent enzyme
MRFRLTDDEAWDLLAAAHTGIFTSLRRDGRPIALPVWFVVRDHQVLIRTPAATKQAARIRHDPRAHFLVEQGTAWSELVAVSFEARGEVLDDEATRAELERLLEAKYGDYQPPTERLPATVRERYERTTVIGLRPAGRISSWNNRALLQ